MNEFLSEEINDKLARFPIGGSIYHANPFMPKPMDYIFIVR